MSKPQKSELMKRVEVEGRQPRVEGALKAEVHTEEYTVLGAIRTRHERLKDVLENWFHPFLPLEEAIVLHRDPSGMINSFSRGTEVYRYHKATVPTSYCQAKLVR